MTPTPDDRLRIAHARAVHRWSVAQRTDEPQTLQPVSLELMAFALTDALARLGIPPLTESERAEAGIASDALARVS